MANYVCKKSWLEVWLIRRKTLVQIPGQKSKRKDENISSATSSQQISGRNSESK